MLGPCVISSTFDPRLPSNGEEEATLIPSRNCRGQLSLMGCKGGCKKVAGRPQFIKVKCKCVIEWRGDIITPREGRVW